MTTTPTKPCKAAREIVDQLKQTDMFHASWADITADVHRVGRFDEQRELLTEARQLLECYCRACPTPPCAVCSLRRGIDAHLSLIGGEDE